MEGDLLAVRDRARDGTSTMAVRDQRDRVAAERAEGAGEAVESSTWSQPWRDEVDQAFESMFGLGLWRSARCAAIWR